MQDDLCALTGRRCHLTRYGQERCSEAPDLEQASDCIKTLDTRGVEMEREISDLDRLTMRLKDALAKQKPPETH
jgi:hypothetical protein